MRRAAATAAFVVLMLMALSLCHAQESELLLAGQAVLQQSDEPEAKKDMSADKTGTNPINFQDTFIVWNEYSDLGHDLYTNQTVFEYAAPLQQNTMTVRVRIPMVTSNISGDTEFGLGDISLRGLKTVELNQKGMYAWVAGLEAWFNTASDVSLGAGKTSLGPLAIFVKFLPKQKMIIAPSYQQKFSIGGSESRADINMGMIDLYIVKMLEGGKRWVMIDPQFLIDFENDAAFGGLFKVTYGMYMGEGKSIYLKPGIGFGEQPVDFSLETGFKVVF